MNLLTINTCVLYILQLRRIYSTKTWFLHIEIQVKVIRVENWVDYITMNDFEILLILFAYLKSVLCENENESSDDQTESENVT